MMLPVEILLLIAQKIDSRWDRLDFLEIHNISHLYYGVKNRRPFDRKFLDFLPRKYKPEKIKETFYTNSNLKIILPIKNDKLKHQKSYVIYVYNRFKEISFTRGRKKYLLYDGYIEN